MDARAQAALGDVVVIARLCWEGEGTDEVVFCVGVGHGVGVVVC